jgi:hypothetical protein
MLHTKADRWRSSDGAMIDCPVFVMICYLPRVKPERLLSVVSHFELTDEFTASVGDFFRSAKREKLPQPTDPKHIGDAVGQ